MNDPFDTSLGQLATGFAEPDAGRPAALVPGETILAGRYRLLRLLGAGGMGAVYEAKDDLAGTRLALKVLKPELVSRDNARERFLQEFRLCQQISHPGVVRAFALDRLGEGYFYTMELAEGPTLGEMLDERKAAGRPFELGEVVHIVSSVLDALEHAHRVTVHRDIKPDNIVMTRDIATGRYQPKLLDFGIAKALEASNVETRANASVGTAYYMAPEQLRGSGQVDARADIYSVGVLFYELLTGDLPLPGTPSPKEARPELPAWVDEVYRLSVAPKEKRYATAARMRQRLLALSATGGTIPAAPGSPATSRSAPARAETGGRGAPPAMRQAPPVQTAPAGRQTGPPGGSAPQPMAPRQMVPQQMVQQQMTPGHYGGYAPQGPPQALARPGAYAGYAPQGAPAGGRPAEWYAQRYYRGGMPPRPQSPAAVVLLSIFTLGIYALIWTYSTLELTRKLRGRGPGGGWFLLALLVVWVPIVGVALLIGLFVALSDAVGKLQRENGVRADHGGTHGLLPLIPLVGGLIWQASVQGALVRFWDEVYGYPGGGRAAG